MATRSVSFQNFSSAALPPPSECRIAMPVAMAEACCKPSSLTAWATEVALRDSPSSGEFATLSMPPARPGSEAMTLETRLRSGTSLLISSNRTLTTCGRGGIVKSLSKFS